MRLLYAVFAQQTVSFEATRSSAYHKKLLSGPKNWYIVEMWAFPELKPIKRVTCQPHNCIHTDHVLSSHYWRATKHLVYPGRKLSQI